MPVISEHWEKLTEEQWLNLAQQYLDEINRNIGKEYNEEDNKWGLLVTEFRFTSSPQLQWRFILLAISLSNNDEQLSDIAAGNIEHLLGWHGEAYIKIVENEAKNNPKFAKAITGVWKYKMTDEVWERVQKLQSESKEKLHK
jgi:hypothetical protein